MHKPALKLGRGWTVTPKERAFGSFQPIKDPRAVGEIVEQLIRKVGSGNEVAAAALILVERSTLNRLRLQRTRVRHARRKHVRIRHVTALRLHHAAATHLGPEWGRKFLRAMGADLARMRAYREWETERLERWARRAGAHWGCEGGRLYLVGRGTRARPFRNGARWRVDAQIQNALKSVGGKTWRMVLAFEDWILHRAGERRARLAWMRIIEPLLECSESAFVEVPWTALSGKDLGRFIEAGILRERILMRARGTDTERVASPCDEPPPASR